MKELYNKKINERSIFKYFLGLLSRIRLYLKYGLIRICMREYEGLILGEIVL